MTDQLKRKTLINIMFNMFNMFNILSYYQGSRFVAALCLYLIFIWILMIFLVYFEAILCGLHHLTVYFIFSQKKHIIS